MIWIAIAALAALPHYVRDVINRGIGTYNASLAVADATVPHCSPNYWNTENATTRPSLLYAYFVVCVNNEDIGWQYAAHIPKIGPVDIFNPNVTVFELLSVDNVPAAMICSCNFRLLATTLSFDAATDTIDASDALVWERSIKFSASDAAIKVSRSQLAALVRPSAIVRVDSVQIYNMGPMHTAVYTPKEPNVQFSYILAWNAAESQSIQTDLVDVKEYEQPSTPDPIKPSQTLWFFLAGTVLTIFKKRITNLLAIALFLTFLLSERHVLPRLETAFIIAVASIKLILSFWPEKRLPTIIKVARLASSVFTVVVLHRLGKRTYAYNVDHFYVETAIALCFNQNVADVFAIANFVRTKVKIIFLSLITNKNKQS